MTDSTSSPNPSSSSTDLRGWFSGRMPAEWFEGAPLLEVDREEITVIGRLTAPDFAPDSSDAERGAATAGRVKAFREDTRDERIVIAAEVEHRTGRKVAWGVTVGDSEQRWLFSHVAAPVMTRLRQPERQVLDTLVEAGVARSRSDALAWCVRLVGKHSEEWLGDLRGAMSEVDRVRRSGP